MLRYGSLQAQMPCKPRNAQCGLGSPLRALQSRRLRHLTQSIRNLPLFPLGMVAFPNTQVPLTIFEARYRVLFSTLLAGGHDIDEDLVQRDSEFLGSKEFGMVWLSDQGGVAKIGTLLQIKAHHMVKDGRLIIQSTGSRRFRILKILQSRPVLLARCEMVDDTSGDGETPEAEVAKEAVMTAFKDVHHLITRLRPEDQPSALSEEEIEQMSPAAFSYQIAQLFAQATPYQQHILQEDSTVKRLNQLQTVLEKHSKYLQAVVALNDVGSTLSVDSAEDVGKSEGDEGDISANSQK